MSNIYLIPMMVALITFSGACTPESAVNRDGALTVGQNITASDITNVATISDCPGPSLGLSSGHPGNRAIISEDGLSLVLQCADATIRAWKAAQVGVTTVSGKTLFEAAKAQGSIPSNLKCSWPDYFKSSHEPDCDILDYTDDKSTYILRNHDIPGSAVTQVGSNSIRELALRNEEPGVLLPRSGPPTSVLVANYQPKQLEIVSLEKRDKRLLLQLPVRNMLFQDGEADPDAITYSATYKLLIVTFTGIFVGERKMAYVRAYTLQGEEKWNIIKQLPSPNAHGFTGDYARILPFADGRYAVFSTENRDFFDIINLETGQKITTLKGLPIATSAKANRILIRTPSDDIVFSDYTLQK